MNPWSIFAIYFIVWWLSLFVVLPWGVRTQADDAEVIPGTEPGAPVRPWLFRKVIATSILAALVTGLVVYLATSGVIALSDLPMPFDTKSY